MDKRVKMGSLIGLLLLMACIGIYFVASQVQKLRLKAPPITLSTLEPDQPSLAPKHMETDLQERLNETKGLEVGRK